MFDARIATIVALASLAWLSAWPLLAQEPAGASPTAQPLTVKELVRRVIDRNETLQARLLDFEASRRRHSAEKAVFVPELTSSFSHEQNSRLNTVEQQRATLSELFSETNNVYNSGIEALAPTGAKIRLGYSLRDLNNNLQSQPSFIGRGATNGEYQSFLGFTVSQPLLKNGWAVGTKTGVRLAALTSSVAYQSYRRQLMMAVSTAEATYWNLHLAQEQVKFFEESVRTARTLLEDAKTRLSAGIGSETDVWEAQSGLALRESKLAEARQRLHESANRVISLYADKPSRPGSLVKAVDAPDLAFVPPSLEEMGQSARQWNPDYLAQEIRAKQEGIKLRYAKNQRLPEVNLNGAYGLNGLGSSVGRSCDSLGGGDYPSWMVGIELRIPMALGTKGKHLVSAARLSEQEAWTELRAIETEILNGLDNGLHKLQTARTSIDSYQTIAQVNENLVKSALARFEAGKLDSRRVLEFEGDLLEARTSVVEAKVQFQRAALEMELISGSTLIRRGVELSQEDLARSTRQYLKHSRLTPEQVQGVSADLNRGFTRLGGAEAPSKASESPARGPRLDQPVGPTPPPPAAGLGSK